MAEKKQTGKEELRYEVLFDINIEVEDKPQEIGNTPHGIRNIYYIKGGTFEGPKLKGQVLPVGGDWLIKRPDGANELDIRTTLQTDEGDLIYTKYGGIIYRLPNSAQTYWRTVWYFETASEKLSWLNRILAVGLGDSEANVVHYKVYKIL